MNRYTDSPCMSCTSRHALCHAECIDYAAWKAYHDAIHAKIQLYNRGYQDAQAVHMNRSTKKNRWLFGLGRNYFA